MAAIQARVPLEDVKDEGCKFIWVGYPIERDVLAGTNHWRKAGPYNTLGV
jgi:hypothetical protein